MNNDLLFVLALLVTAVVLFVINKPRMDVVALLIIVALPLSGVINLKDALAGFSDPNVILIAALFVVGEGLVRTGVAHQLGQWLTHRAGASETRLIVLLMLIIATLGSVMSSTGVVAIFIPVVLNIARSTGIGPSHLMMPLSVAALISGMLTLVGTPPNMVVHSELVRSGHEGFGFFDFTPVGIPVLLLGIGYMLYARRWLPTQQAETSTASASRRRIADLVRDYRLEGRERRLRILPASRLAGQKLATSQLRSSHGATVVGVEREGRFGREVLSPAPNTVLHSGDVILLDFLASEVELRSLCSDLQLERLPFDSGYFDDRTQEIGMVEMTLPPESRLIGKSIMEIGFRTRYNLNVVGIRRDKQILDRFGETKLRLGDTLLVIGPWRALRKQLAQPDEFLLFDLPAEGDEALAAPGRSPLALLSLAVMIGLMVTGIVPNVLAALIACLLMGLFRCVDMNSAYRSIHWQSLILIVGMLPFATALEKTGGIAIAVDFFVNLAGRAQPHAMLAALFVVTAGIGLFISNTATAVLMAPVAVGIAEQMHISPRPFALIVALAASTAFMTPISSPVNTLVVAPGNYRFGDFVKVGVPFALVVLVVCVLIVPLVYPFE
jgi:di/tricarboxylate transporter